MPSYNISTPDPAFYRGDPGAANAEGDRLIGRSGENDPAQNAIDRGIHGVNKQSGNVKQVIQDPTLANNAASRAGGNQDYAIGLAGTLARGQQPSQAAYQLQSGLNQASAQQAAMGRSARGGASIATAGANQAANTANLQQNAWTQGGLLKSRDMAAGRGMLSSGLGQSRQQDIGDIAEGLSVTQGNAGLRDAGYLGMKGAAVGLGGVQEGMSGVDADWYGLGIQPVEQQSGFLQDKQGWRSDARRQSVNNNLEG